MSVIEYDNGTFEIDNSDEAFIRVIREIVKGNESFVYEGCPVTAAEQMAELGLDKLDGPVCRYVHRQPDGTSVPGCLIGQVLIKMGVPLDFFTDVWNSSTAHVVMTVLGFSPEIRSAASWAQSEQDAQREWEKALEAFERRYAAFMDRPTF